MGFMNTIASFLMLAVTKAMILPQNSFNYTVYIQDKIQIPLNNEMFIMSNPLNSSCSTYSSIGDVIYPNDILTQQDYTTYSFSAAPTVTEFINNITYFAVYDNVNVVVQNLTLNHYNFSAPFMFTIPSVGANLACTDVELNTILNRVYIGCGTSPNAPNQTETSSVFIYEVDFTSGNLINTVNFDVPKITHRIQLKIAPIRNEKAPPTSYLLAYDQGISSGLPESNIWVAVLNGPSAGNLFIPTVLNLSTSNLNFLSMYDMFPHRDQLLVTGKNSASPSAPIMINLCSINSNQGTLNLACSSTPIPSVFNTTYGFVGVLNTGQYVEVNANPSNPGNDYLYICNFEGKFGNPDFVDSMDCLNASSFAVPDDATISIVEGNKYQAVVKYTHFNGDYAGYSLHSFFLNHSYSHIEEANPYQAVPFATTLILLNQTGAYLTRQVFPYYFVSFDAQTNLTFQMVRIDCSDADTQNATFIFNLSIMHDMRDLVSANTTVVPQLAAYEGENLLFAVDPSKILGNDLTLSLQVSNTSGFSNLTRQAVFDIEAVNLMWSMESGNTNFQNLRFVGRWAITQSKNGWISFSNCKFTGTTSVLCVEKGAVNIPVNTMNLHKHVYTVFNWVFAFGVDNTANITKFFIFDTTNEQITVHSQGGAVSDASIAENGNNAILAFAFKDLGIVHSWSFSNIDPTSYARLLPLAVHNSGMDVFCPQDIDFDPENGAILEVFSICQNDQRIMRYVYPPQIQNNYTVIQQIGNVPINLAYTQAQYCSMGTEFVVAANITHGNLTQKINIQSYNVWADRNSWTFGTLTDDLELGNVTSFNCVPRVGVFTTVSVNSTGNMNLAVYRGNNQYQANQKVFGSVRGGLDMYSTIESFDMLGDTIHVLIPSSGPVNAKFMFSFSSQVYVDLQLLRGIGNNSLPISLTWSNAMNSASVLRNIAVTNPYASINAQSIKVMNGDPNNVTFCLEDYTQFMGPVTDGYLTNHTDKVYLAGRVHTLKPYLPPTEHSQLISQMETFNDITITLHKSPISNASTFTFFQNVSDFWGIQAPFLAVNSFHFAPFIYTDNNTVFIAYSTAGAVNNTLQFLILNNTQVQSIGYFPDDEIRNYTKIKVVPIGSANSSSFMIFAKNGDEQQLHVFRADIVGNRIVPQVLNNIPNVYDFDWAQSPGTDTFYLFVVWSSLRTNVDFDVYNSTSGESVTKQTVSLPELIRKNNALGSPSSTESIETYDIISLSARWYPGQSLSLVLNTLSNRIYELIQGQKVYVYWKLPGYDGMLIDSNKDHIVQLVSSNIHDTTTRLAVYKKVLSGGDGNIYWTVHNDIGRAFTLLTSNNNVSHLQVAHPFENAPLWFYTIDRMYLTVGAGASIQGINLQLGSVGGFLPVSYSLNDIIDGNINPGPKPTPTPTPSSSGANWLPFILVVIVLVLLAIGLISWKAISDKPAASEDNADNYRSLKADGTKKSETEA
jgi:hypothetical protein